MEATDISNLGAMKCLTGNCDNPMVWTGPISADAADTDNLTSVLSQLAYYFVIFDKTASTRCIDGRPHANYASDPDMLTRRLGAQLAGCTPVVALAVHLVTTIDDTRFTLSQDVSKVVATLQSLGMGFGAHTDDMRSSEDEDTGCGALDKMPAILSKLLQPEAIPQIKILAAQLMGDRYKESVVDQLLTRVKSLQVDADWYLERNPANGSYLSKRRSIAAINKAASNAVEVLHGEHKEKGLVLNLVRNRTFDRDKFSKDHSSEIELFNYDVWFADDIAKALFAQSVEPQNAFFTFHVMYSLATSMVLTDGSLPLIVRS